MAVSTIIDALMPAAPARTAGSTTPLVPELGPIGSDFYAEHTTREIEETAETNAFYDDAVELPTCANVGREDQFYDTDEAKKMPEKSPILPTRTNGDCTKSEVRVSFEVGSPYITVRLHVKEYEHVGRVLKRPEELEQQDGDEVDVQAAELAETER